MCESRHTQTYMHTRNSIACRSAVGYDDDDVPLLPLHLIWLMEFFLRLRMIRILFVSFFGVRLHFIVIFSLISQPHGFFLVCSFVRSLAFNILACLPLTGLFVRRNFKHNIYNIKHGVWARMCLCFFLHPAILVAERLLLAFVCFAVLRLFFRFRSFCLAYECVNVWEPEMVFALFFGSISKLWIIAHKIICFRVWYMVTQLLNSLVHIYVQPIQMRTVIFASYA